MNKELYYELSDIEDRLFEIMHIDIEIDIETICTDIKLFVAWKALYEYLIKINPDDLE